MQHFPSCFLRQTSAALSMHSHKQFLSRHLKNDPFLLARSCLCSSVGFLYISHSAVMSFTYTHAAGQMPSASITTMTSTPCELRVISSQIVLSDQCYPALPRLIRRYTGSNQLVFVLCLIVSLPPEDLSFYPVLILFMKHAVDLRG